MRLLEALSLRKDLLKRIEQLRERAANNALVQEGEEPTEDPNVLLGEIEELAAQLERLIIRINLTNAVARIESGQTLTEAIARRDMLKVRRGVITNVADTASGEQGDRRLYGRRATRTELRNVPQVNVRALRNQADTLAQEARLLDQQIQVANVTTDVIEE